MNRRGISVIGLVTVLGLLMATTLVFLVGVQFQSERFGLSETTLFRMHQQAGYARDYMSQAAQYTLRQGVADIAAQGGYAERRCGPDYLGLRLWSARSNCHPSDTDVKTLLANSLNEGLQQYARNMDGAKEVIVADNRGVEGSAVLRTAGSWFAAGISSERGGTAVRLSTNPPFRIESSGAFEYKLKQEFSQWIGVDVLNDFRQLTASAPDVKARMERGDPAVSEAGMVWHGGSCPGTPTELKEFYRFAEVFMDCGQQSAGTCTCGGYDVSRIPDGYEFIIRQDGQRTLLGMRGHGKSAPEESVMSEESNVFHEAYRYTCSGGDADCSLNGRCVTNQLRSDTNNCGACGVAAAAPYVCEGGREVCRGGVRGAACSMGDEGPEYRTGSCVARECVAPNDCLNDCYAADGNGNCIYCTEWDDAAGECLADSSACQDWVPVEYCSGECTDYATARSQCEYDHGGIQCGWVQGAPQSAPPAPAAEYPAYSYDYGEAFVSGRTLVLDRNACERFREYCQEGKLQFVRLHGDVGLLKAETEPVDMAGRDGRLQAWPSCTEKKTYRFCVETNDKLLLYAEKALEEKPLRYQFAVRFS